jgi:hypothetical protein
MGCSSGSSRAKQSGDKEGSSLPVRLRYLEPVRKQLAALAADDIHENTDLSVLRKVVRRRVKGLSAEESRTVLAEDAAELEKWLSSSTGKDERLYFITPILPDAVEILLVERPPTPPERGEVTMDLPGGAKVTKENGCWSVKCGRLYLELYPSHREEMHSTAGRSRGDAKSRPMTAGDGFGVVDVQFGRVVGLKCVSRRASLKSKQVNYALEVPGGYVVADLFAFDKDFDESELEAYFHTLRVLNYPPPPIPPAK